MGLNWDDTVAIVEEDHRSWHRMNPVATPEEHAAFLQRMGISTYEDLLWHARTNRILEVARTPAAVA